MTANERPDQVPSELVCGKIQKKVSWADLQLREAGCWAGDLSKCEQGLN